MGKRIRTDVIAEQWDDVLRLVGSIKAGHVAPSVMLRKLAAYSTITHPGQKPIGLA